MYLIRTLGAHRLIRRTIDLREKKDLNCALWSVKYGNYSFSFTIATRIAGRRDRANGLRFTSPGLLPVHHASVTAAAGLQDVSSNIFGRCVQVKADAEPTHNLLTHVWLDPCIHEETPYCDSICVFLVALPLFLGQVYQFGCSAEIAVLIVKYKCL